MSGLPVVNRTEPADWLSRELSISIVVAASAMGSLCHLLLWHSGFRWQQRKKYALGPGRISK